MSNQTKGKYVGMILVTDPDTGLPVEVELWKLEGGGIMGVDGSFLSNTELPVYSCFDKDTEVIDPEADGPIDNNLVWLNDQVQFARLISEIQSCGGFTKELMEELADAGGMDLEPEEIMELTVRADKVYEWSKGMLK